MSVTRRDREDWYENPPGWRRYGEQSGVGYGRDGVYVIANTLEEAQVRVEEILARFAQGGRHRSGALVPPESSSS